MFHTKDFSEYILILFALIFENVAFWFHRIIIWIDDKMMGPRVKRAKPQTHQEHKEPTEEPMTVERGIWSICLWALVGEVLKSLLPLRNFNFININDAGIFQTLAHAGRCTCEISHWIASAHGPPTHHRFLRKHFIFLCFKTLSYFCSFSFTQNWIEFDSLHLNCVQFHCGHSKCENNFSVKLDSKLILRDCFVTMSSSLAMHIIICTKPESHLSGWNQMQDTKHTASQWLNQQIVERRDNLSIGFFFLLSLFKV